VGIFDIDDVILNALGVMVGFWGTLAVGRWRRTKDGERRPS
jgi:glycopeptide antibiotics resistance protein